MTAALAKSLIDRLTRARPSRHWAGVIWAQACLGNLALGRFLGLAKCAQLGRLGGVGGLTLLLVDNPLLALLNAFLFEEGLSGVPFEHLVQLAAARHFLNLTHGRSPPVNSMPAFSNASRMGVGAVRSEVTTDRQRQRGRHDRQGRGRGDLAPHGGRDGPADHGHLRLELVAGEPTARAQ